MISIEFSEFGLPGGLQAIMGPDRNMPVFAVGVWDHAGSKLEERMRTGFAHLFEHNLRSDLNQ